MQDTYDIAVLGAGPGGYIAALKAAALGAKVAVVEPHLLGGTCLNYGCIPSKALLASAQLLHEIDRADAYGIQVPAGVGFDWSAIQARKDSVLKKLRGGIRSLLGSRNVDIFSGRGQLDGPGRVLVSDGDGPGQQIQARKIILAVGSVPSRIPDWPSDPEYVCTSDEALHWKQLPKRVMIVGGGVIGCEFACMMHRFGVDVTIVEMLPNLLPNLDSEPAGALEKIFAHRGITCLLDARVEELSRQDSHLQALLSDGQSIEVDKALVATGRKPNTGQIGLESVGIKTRRGFVPVNEAMETRAPGVYCIGDANGQCLLAHAASAQGIIAVEDALGLGHTAPAQPIPWCVYTFPEIAGIGMTTQEAREKKLPVAIGKFPLSHLGKAMAGGHDEGFVKVLRHRNTDEILGVHMIGHNVTEVIAAAGCMLGQGASTTELAETVFAHPTISESVKEAAEDALGQALHLPPRKMTRLQAAT
jgi:dihydrolipoamide dehydrogenase